MSLYQQCHVGVVFHSVSQIYAIASVANRQNIELQLILELLHSTAIAYFEVQWSIVLACYQVFRARHKYIGALTESNDPLLCDKPMTRHYI